MKILILSSIFPPKVFGGAEVAAYNMARLLVRLGHDVSVATLKEHDADMAWGKKMPEGFSLYSVITPRPYTLFGRTGKIPFWKKILWHIQDYIDPRNVKNINTVLDEVRPDQVDIHNLIGFGFNVLHEIAIRTIPVNYVLHDLHLVCFHTSMFKKGKNCLKPCDMCHIIGSLRQKSLEKIQSLGFISPSQVNLDRIIPFAPIVKKSRHIVIRNVSDELPKVVIKEESTILKLLFVGRLDEGKGIKFLLSVLGQLSQHYEFKFFILGTGPLAQALQAQYKQFPWVIFRGFVSSQDVALAIAQADIFCMPSLWAESYGLVTAQALQMGVPVIGSNIGGTAELVQDGETGMLLEPGNEKVWYEALEKIFNDVSLLEQWRYKMPFYKTQFNEDTIGRLYDDFSSLHHKKKTAIV